jgi:hypothetical protein
MPKKAKPEPTNWKDYITPKNAKIATTTSQVLLIGASAVNLLSFHPLDAAMKIGVALYLEKGVVFGLDSLSSAFSNYPYAKQMKEYSGYIRENYSPITFFSNVVSTQVSKVASNLYSNNSEDAHPKKRRS